ncbi:MAG TPA: FAD-dependent oxidoreductase [Deltaproteobacteria bacterium]|nr:FAD-dependent oxidoreductase [Deltaproteobacteria bacterium]OQC29061.1 MAG: NADH peroxidase [Deltaproteobacteria bacterium ADurb.Bin072]NMD41524.1 FAD-dependent oxidoreductase [Deltaproteobacteria bacterium]HNQ84620.1 FAD-dependent oxidoreductase [Deltaproteobacteria bacterium]HNS88550.1 FAD-dependent oxidoreductase [Deltaproteobacteria bacterium]
MADRKRIVIIGGSAAGPKAAAKARRMDEHAEVVILQKDADLSMASCGYPYYVGGYFDDRNMLLCTPAGIVRDPQFYLNAKNIKAGTNTEVTGIDRKAHEVSFKSLLTGVTGTVAYDKLVIATGATPRMPPIPGVDLKGITTLQSMKDADFLRRVRDEGTIKKAVIIGGGLIGIETCEALQLAGVEITVIELLPQLLTFLDWDLAKLVENHVKTKNANVITGNGIVEFLGENGRLTGVKLANGTELPCELAVVAIGVIPNVKLAREAGLSIGATGGIEVNEYMQTSDPDIYAVGDCVETVHRITGKKVLAPYGDLANLQGRVAGENAVMGNTVIFPGTIQTGICKVFDYSAGSTGLSETSAKKNGYDDIVTVMNASTDKPNFMGGELIITKLVCERSTGKILGAQCIGPGNAAKQIAQWAMAIQAGMHVEDIVNADLPYAPPFSLAIDHFIATAHLMQNKLKGRLKGVSPMEVRKKLDEKDRPFFIDARGPDEYEQVRLGIGETLIPLGALRRRLGELPQDKDREIVCYCKISLRGYEAALVLEANGWRNVKVMEGGIAAWPYAREK